MCESDFSKNLASEEAQESDSVEAYEQQTQENKAHEEHISLLHLN